MTRSTLNLSIPVGTQVVVRVARYERGIGAGAVGDIVQAPEGDIGAYLVRFPDGAEAPFLRTEFSIRKEAQREGLEPVAPGALGEHVIYRCVVGSRAYGLDHDASDVDRRGIYLAPAELQWSLYGVREQLEDQDAQECYWELQKFLLLALKANPNVLECLYTPLVETAAPLAQELLGMREIFLSRLIYQTYNGYAMSQFKKLEADVRTTGSVKWKHAMHLVRLLLSGAVALREGTVPVRVEEHRDRLLAVRHGQVPWEEVDAWRLELHRQFDAALESTRLPDRPDYERANAFLIRARRSQVTP